MNASASFRGRISGLVEGRRSRLRALAVALFLLVLACALGYVALSLSACRAFSPLSQDPLQSLLGPTGGLALALVGFIITYARPANRIGWLCSLGGLILILSPVLESSLGCALAGQISLPGMALIAWFSYVLLPPLFLTIIFLLMPLWFPTGRFFTRRWHALALVLLALLAVTTLPIAITPTFREANSVGVAIDVDNPVGLSRLPAGWGPFWANLQNLIMILGSLLAAAGMIWRLSKSQGVERQQLRLFTFWICMMIIQLVVYELIGYRLAGRYLDTARLAVFETSYYLFLYAVFLGLPLIIGIAVFKYRLFEIDLILNRTLVYGGLSVAVIAVYVAVVGGLGALFQAQGSLLLALLATGLVAVTFQPIRDRLQRRVNRLMFGERDDPYAVLSGLSARLQTTGTPAEMLQSLVEAVATSLKLPFVAIELADAQGHLGGAETGRAVAETTQLPLRYQNELVGRLVVSPRAPGERFAGRERRLLTDIASQAGAIAYSVRLTAALQRSRERLVLAREEERRRIRRDLHDELGPTLASQTFVFDAVLEVMESNPREATHLIEGLKAQNQQIVAEIRRLVHALRPPTLDELGLVGALQAHTAQFNGYGDVTIRIKARPEPFPSLPAAVEAAAYRIALEAITNVLRHAGAGQCDVHLHLEQTGRPGAAGSGRTHLRVEISDDGSGLPAAYQPGIGLHSMRDRAEELGGSCRITAGAQGGTLVTALLPVSIADGRPR